MDSAVNLNKCGGEWHRLIAGINHIFPAAAGYGLVDPSLSLVIHSQRADKNTKGINRVEPNLSLSLSLSLILSPFVSGSRFDLDSQNIPCPKWFKRKKEPRPPTLKKKKESDTKGGIFVLLPLASSLYFCFFRNILANSPSKTSARNEPPNRCIFNKHYSWGRLFASEKNNAGTYILHWKWIWSLRVPCDCQFFYLFPAVDTSRAARPK